MNSENNASRQGVSPDNELDIRGLCCTLWSGKIWIIGFALLFAVVALGASYLMQPKWSALAMTEKPTVNNLGSYYSQSQFLRNLDTQINPSTFNSSLSISDEAYQEFITQIAAFDTRREFWLQTDYYKQRKESDEQANAALLDELINNIQFIPADEKKLVNDQLKLIAETSKEASQLLNEYIAFANKRASTHLNEEVIAAWATRTQSMKALVKRQEMAARAAYQRQINLLEQSMKIAEKQGISQKQTSIAMDELPDSKLFMLGVPLLQSQLETLIATGPDFDSDYDQNTAMLATLAVGAKLQDNFQTYRFLRTPEDPVKRDSPRRAFMMVLWGAIGVLVGAGVALTKRKSLKNNN
ncbi:MAG TPA: ECA polysaccharide chain length modulation protein [Proteus sp.]|nr:ECA polysaccharide chain length modulation protein [Proteus sp. (in: enterobacteria)]